MSNIWFIFENNGSFLFKTTQETNINFIPGNITSPYIVKNPPGYNTDIEQVATYDIATSSVVFTEATTLAAIGSSTITGPSELVDYKKIQEDLLAAQGNIIELQTKISALELRLADNEGILNTAFPTNP